MPTAELCGPGHPLFDALVDHVIVRTTDDLARGAVLVDPDTEHQATLAVLCGEVIDGTSAAVHQGLAALLVHPDGRFERPRFATLYDLVVPEPPILADMNTPVVVAETLEMWSRQHVFEDKFQTVRKEREHVADIQVEFLARSFNGLLAQADTAIMAAEEDVTAGAQGAEGRLRKAELAKATQVVTRDRRIALARQGRVVHRGSVRVVGLCRLGGAVPSSASGTTERPPKRRGH